MRGELIIKISRKPWRKQPWEQGRISEVQFLSTTISFIFFPRTAEDPVHKSTSTTNLPNFINQCGSWSISLGYLLFMLYLCYVFGEINVSPIASANLFIFPVHNSSFPCSPTPHLQLFPPGRPALQFQNHSTQGSLQLSFCMWKICCP